MSRINDTRVHETTDRWRKIGPTCSAGRRSMWMRVTDTRMEVCAGREGDDDYLVIESDNPVFAALLDIFYSAHFASWS